jgi:hypothetical protein
MKKILFLAFAVTALVSCSDHKAEEKAALNDVIKIHDKVMADDEQLNNNKMQLDTLAKQNSFVKKDSAMILNVKLNSAETLMDNWMHSFNPDHTGKSHEETMDYLGTQKKQIMAIDSQLSSAVKESTLFLKKAK